MGWARQREVAGFCTGPATVLGSRGALLPAGGAAVCAAALSQQAVPSQQHQAQQQQIDAHSNDDDGGDGEQQGGAADRSRGWIPRARGGLDSTGGRGDKEVRRGCKDTQIPGRRWTWLGKVEEEPPGDRKSMGLIALPFRLPPQTDLSGLLPLHYFPIPQPTELAPNCLATCNCAPFHTSCSCVSPPHTPLQSINGSH